MAVFPPRWLLPLLCPLTPHCSQPGPWGKREGWGGTEPGTSATGGLDRLPIGSTGNTELLIHASDSRGWFLPTAGKMRMTLEAVGGRGHCMGPSQESQTTHTYSKVICAEEAGVTSNNGASWGQGMAWVLSQTPLEFPQDEGIHQHRGKGSEWQQPCQASRTLRFPRIPSLTAQTLRLEGR